MVSSRRSKLENPGYSFKAAKFNFWKMKYEGGGVVWVGEKGGDTPEKRELFIKWYLQNMPYANVDSIKFIE